MSKPFSGRGVYMVYSRDESRTSGIILNLRRAKRVAKKNPGSFIRGMPYGLYKDGQQPYGWDFPTFKISSYVLK